MDDQQDATKTICPYCGVGCGIAVTDDMRFVPWGDAPVNDGRICIEGGAATEVVEHEDRLTEPMVRDGGDLREATWEEAYGRIVDGMERIRDERGADAMGF